ncbi:SUMF1/EgtB/PvdO family nonheme iron enzyme [Gimesia aquarii]|uniref:Serine/threonine-protein kinase pkn1 n=1 Tax=Gimesia aquarii TaxID=2527964 RepID=A0A517WR42_9PLAN|nr:SUMF1/EgtB/PvdO family nonheme iron enzyme [Gimesia aquarii]QDU07724.1 Serine/threonine-protein kinase pkn1 [Gimesia aquarii]
MTTKPQLRLSEIEQKVLDVASEQLGFPRNQISLSDRLIEDLRCDSLDAVELLMELEDAFNTSLPEPSESSDPVYKTIFTRQPFRLADLTELVYLNQGTGTPDRSRHFRQPKVAMTSTESFSFTQLDGRWERNGSTKSNLFESVETKSSYPQFRRRSDGMRCIQIPTADEVEIGSDRPDAIADEKPKHIVELDAFLIDAEPVSTTAYCRFLNSIGEVPDSYLTDWFVLDADDDRNIHMLIRKEGSEWQPLPGCEKWPMILVSWYGANAYSLWANDKLWLRYQDESHTDAGSYLPTEAQWEYAARGQTSQPYPWGSESPSQDRMRFGFHRKSIRYDVSELPLADVNARLGMSLFGLHHMAGNVWQWCRDWYDAEFYQRLGAMHRNPFNQTNTRVRSERGGSWVGPAQLCRSSYRRGRTPLARGRCLGFRCISSVRDLQ